MTTYQLKSTDVPLNTKTKNKELFGWVRFVLILLAIFLLFRFGVAISIISGSSMEPTYQDGSVVISNTILFEPELQDIVIYSDNNGFDVIKRVIGTPGDTVEILQGTVLVNGVALEEGYTLGAADSMPMVKLAPDAYFLIGDHRTPGESYDSRSEEIGAIPLNAIKGEVLFSIN